MEKNEGQIRVQGLGIYRIDIVSTCDQTTFLFLWGSGIEGIIFY